jgi:hypothetical protein
MSGVWRLLLPLMATAALGGGCGQVSGDCSGGSLSGDTCVPYPGVHWTDAKATAAAADLFRYSTGLQGTLTHPRCRVVAHLRYYEARSICHVRFLQKGRPARAVVVALHLSGHGVANPDCARRWRSNPYCAGKGRLVTSAM